MFLEKELMKTEVAAVGRKEDRNESRLFDSSYWAWFWNCVCRQGKNRNPVCALRNCRQWLVYAHASGRLAVLHRRLWATRMRNRACRRHRGAGPN